MNKIASRVLYVVGLGVLGGAAALILASCHFADAVKDAGPGGPLDASGPIGNLPGALAGNPASILALAGWLASFVATATVGHRVGAGRWVFQKPIVDVTSDVFQAAVAAAAKDLTPVAPSVPVPVSPPNKAN